MSRPPMPSSHQGICQLEKNESCYCQRAFSASIVFSFNIDLSQCNNTPIHLKEAINVLNKYPQPKISSLTWISLFPLGSFRSCHSVRIHHHPASKLRLLDREETASERGLSNCLLGLDATFRKGATFCIYATHTVRIHIYTYTHIYAK